MPTVANLAVSVTARTSKFNKKMQRAGKNVRAFGRDVAAVGKRLVQFGTVASGAAVAGMTIAVRQSFKLIDATSKLASTFGIATDQLIGMQHGAVIMGSSMEGMNKALKEFVRRLGEASTRSGEARDAIRMLGLDESALVATGTAEAIKTVADRIAALPDAFQQAEAAYRLFGRQGTQLVKLMRLGREGIDDFIHRVDLMGLTFTDLQSVALQNTNDALFDLRQVMRGTANQLSHFLVPYIGAAATALTNMSIAGDGVRSRVAKVFEIMRTGIGKAANLMQLMSAEWHAFRGVVLVTGEAFAKVFAGMIANMRQWFDVMAISAKLLGPVLPKEFRTLANIHGAMLNTLLRDTDEYFKSLVRTFAEDIASAAEAMNKALAKFASGNAARKVSEWLAGIVDKWNELAKQTELRPAITPRPMLPFESLRGGGAGAAARIRPVEFKEISLARVAIQGVSAVRREQLVRDPQLARTNEILDRLERNWRQLPGLGLTS